MFKAQTLIVLLMFTMSCQLIRSNSVGKQIFTDAQRYDMDLSKFLILTDTGCTGFLIDRDVAISADHCAVKIKSPICFQSEFSGPWLESGTCKMLGEVTEIVEKSDVYKLDYIIFKVKWTGDFPVESVKLARSNILPKLQRSSTAIKMLGYPVDKYRKGKLTESRCRVRSSEIKPHFAHQSSFFEGNFERRNQDLFKFWEAKGLASEPDFDEMMRNCGFLFEEYSKFERLSFVTDCSVYGGNSGGPILYDDVVVGMPASYLPEEDGPDSDSCFRDYWDKFFRPFFKTDKPRIFESHDWDKLDRNSDDFERFPLAIPMHLIVSQSDFLRKHPEYLRDPK